MAFSHTPKNTGDVIRSADWNEALDEVVRLEQEKLNTSGGGIDGKLSVSQRIGIGTVNPMVPLHINIGSEATASANTGLMQLGSDTGYNMSLDTNEIQARLTNTPNYLTLNPHGGAVYIPNNIGIGTSTPSVKFQIYSGANVTLADNSGYMLLGRENTSNLALDSNTIQARYNGGATTLRLNEHGGTVYVKDRIGIGTTIPNTPLNVYTTGSSNDNLSLSDNTGLVLVGNHNSQNIVLDTNNIQSRMNGAASALNLNTFGGDVIMCESSGKIGMGTDTPGATLHIARKHTTFGKYLAVGNILALHATMNHQGMNAYDGNSITNLELNTVGNVSLSKFGGKVGIGLGSSTEPAASLQVARGNELTLADGSGYMVIGLEGSYNLGFDNNEIQSRHNGNATNLFLNPAGGNVYAGGTYLGSSDVRLKTNIAPLDSSMSKLNAIKGVSFKWRDGRREQSDNLGLLAQNVEEVFPELVATDNKGFKAVNYSGFVAPIIEALKEQNEALARVTAQSEGITGKVETLFEERSGADYAEFFESANGKKIPEGTPVVFEKGKVRPAKAKETPVGVISSNPGILRGAYTEWPGKYQRDEMGNILMEEVKEELLIPKTKKVKINRQKTEKKTVKEEAKRTEVVFEKGKYRQKEIVDVVEREVEVPLFDEMDIYDAAGKKVIDKKRMPVMETVTIQQPVVDKEGKPVMVGSGKYRTVTRRKLSPDYNPKKEYTPRMERDEWCMVGLLGQLHVRKGMPTAPGWIKLKEVSKGIELWLVK